MYKVLCLFKLGSNVNKTSLLLKDSIPYIRFSGRLALMKNDPVEDAAPDSLIWFCSKNSIPPQSVSIITMEAALYSINNFKIYITSINVGWTNVGVACGERCIRPICRNEKWMNKTIRNCSNTKHWIDSRNIVFRINPLTISIISTNFCICD